MSTLIYYQEPFSTIYRADAFSLLKVLPRESVHCVVTSPPYWGLRKYEGQQELIWGGDRNCKHVWGDAIKGREYGRHDTNDPTSTDFGGWANWDGDIGNQAGHFCSLCGAWKGSFGLEPTPEMYVQHTIEALRAIRWVLRKDGVVWWNIGDSYAGSPAGNKEAISFLGNKPTGRYRIDNYDQEAKRDFGIIKSEDLCLIPLRIVIAAQKDGWYVRSKVVWHKPNPMPESVNGWRWERHKIRVDESGNRVRKGGKLVECPGCEVCLPNDRLVLRKGSWRPTNTYEFILMLTKSDDYYGDADSVREKANPETQRSKSVSSGIASGNVFNGDRRQNYEKNRHIVFSRNLRDIWSFPTESFGMEMCIACGHIYDSASYRRLPINTKSKTPSETEARGRPLESPIHPYRGDGWEAQTIEGRDTEIGQRVCRCGASEWLSHFATFPEKLPELCIKASTSEKGCCPKCGAPWARVAEHHITETLGWRSTCNCGNLEPVPCTVLDPFMGTGRTLLVAKKLGRKSIGVDISENYCKLAKKQVSEVNLPLLLF